MGTGRPEDQALPTPNDYPYVQDLMQKDITLEMQKDHEPDLDVVLVALSASIEERRKLGHQRYKVPGLQPFNGRDMLRDAFEEILDAAVYTKALACERGGDFDDVYVTLMTEAMFLQAAILDRDGYGGGDDAATEAPAEPEADPVH